MPKSPQIPPVKLFIALMLKTFASLKPSPYIGLGGGLGAAPWKSRKGVLLNVFSGITDVKPIVPKYSTSL